MKRRASLILTMTVIAAAVLSNVFVAQAANVLWSSAGGSAWLTGGNWTGGSVPTGADVAQFGTNPTGGATGIGINMNGATNNGANNQAVGAIEVSSARAANLMVGNSSPTVGGTLTLNGVTVNSVANVIVRNNSSQLLTIQNTQGGGGQTMDVALGNATDNVINIDGAGGVTINSVVSGADRRLTLGGTGTGALTLGGANNYSGDTTISSGRLALSGSGSVANSPSIIIAGGATFDVTGLTASLTLAAGQGLKGSGTTSTGTIATASGKGLTTAPNSPLQFTAFDGTTAPLTISGGGAVTLQSGNPVNVNTTTPLGAGDYALIAKGASGTVAGAAPTSLTVGGSGLAGGMVASLRITDGQLLLHVAPAGTLQFGSAAYSVGEGGVSVTLNVTRTGGGAAAVSVNYATSDGTAVAGKDYTAESGTLDWPAGDSADKAVTVFVTNDNIYEGAETFGVTLSSPSGATLGTPSTATVTVDDNDPAPSASAGDVTVAEPSSSIIYALLPVTLSNPSASTATVNYATADGTAAAPDDYTAASGTVTFAAGETTKTVAVVIKADSVLDANETFTLSLSGPSGATVADATGTATITAPVPPGAILISEFRLGGPDGPNDEFVELYNNTDEDITVTDANPVTCAAQPTILDATQRCGWALMDVQGEVSSTPRYVVPTLRTDVIPSQPNVIPARGHLLLAGSGYSLSALAAPDFNYPTPAYVDSDFNGLALYKTADRARLATSTPFDSVGFDGVAPPYREGNGLLPVEGVTPYNGGTAYAEHSFVRIQPSGRPADSGDNRADITLVATNPLQVINGTAVLGAPGPQNRASLVSRNSQFGVSFIPGVASNLRNTSAAGTNAALGTLSSRRRFTNNTGAAVSRLRFRVSQLSTWNSMQTYANQAELRVLDAQLAGLPNTVKKTMVETPPAQPNGGGVNTGLLVNGSLVLAQPIPAGQSVDVEFLFGVMRGGSYQFIVIVEAGQ